jgi:PKD repeat protein
MAGPIEVFEGGEVLNQRVSRSSALLVASMLVATAIFAVAGPAYTPKEKPRSWITDPALRDLMVQLYQNVSTEFLKSKIENLTNFTTRYVHADNHPLVIDWVMDQFKQMGYEPQRWNFDHQGNDRMANVIATINGTGSDQYFIICAHLDSYNRDASWSFPNSPAPGADDDASGLAAILAVAKAFAGYKFYYGIKFIAFDAEELTKGVGSTKYVQNLTAQNDLNLRGVLNVDMIGYNPNYLKLDIDYILPSYWMYTDYIEPVNNEFYFIEHLYGWLDPQNPNYWGDVTAFWNAGYNGVAFEENLDPGNNWTYYTANTYFHTSNDTIEKINWELVTRATRLIMCSLLWMAQPTLPDLSPTKVLAPKGPYFEGDNLGINVTINNTGTVNVSKLRVDMLIDGNLSSSTNVSVDALSFTNYTFHWNAIRGDHRINFTVDPKGSIGEWRENNNNASKDLIILGRPDIDLIKFDVFEDIINSGDLAHLSVEVLNHGPNYIECTLMVTDSLDPENTMFSEFVGLDTGAQWDKVFDWGSNVNGTHVLLGQLTKCKPSDKNLSNDQRSDNVTVNGPPRASLKAEPKDGAFTYQDIMFSGTGSFDDMSLQSYLFDFGDGNETGWTAQSVAKHNYTKDGTYTASLTVKDVQGSESPTVKVQVTVNNRPPVAVAKADRYSAPTGAPISFSSKESYDLDGKILLYNWSFLPEGQTSNKADPVMSFAKMGNFTARLLIVDDDGASITASFTFQILDRPPKADVTGPRTILVGKLAKFSASGSSDPDGTIRQYYWDFGDTFKASGMEPVHAYKSPGNYTVTLTVMDNNGNTDIATWKITVQKEPIINKKTLMDPAIWVLGTCTAVLVVVCVYTTAPGPTRPVKHTKPVKKMRPIKKPLKKKQGPKKKAHRTR